MPDGSVSDLSCKQLRELGKYELSYDVTKKGTHILNIELHGDSISGEISLSLTSCLFPPPSNSHSCLFGIPSHLALVWLWSGSDLALVWL